MSELTPNTPNPVREDAYKQQLAAKLGIDPKYIPGSPIWHSEEEIAAIAEMFSNMAGGGGSSGGGVLVVNFDGTALDKTWQEISDAGVCVISATLEDTAYYMPVTEITTGNGKITPWSVTAITVMEGNTTILTFNASSATDYPAYSE